MLRILCLEDQPDDAVITKRALTSDGLAVDFTVAQNRAEFVAALAGNRFDLVLADHGLPGFSGIEALKLAREKFQDIGFICVTGAASDEQVKAGLKAGATSYALKDHPWQLIAAVRQEQERLRLARADRAKARLVKAVQELSLARDLQAVMDVVRHAARELTGADGATFVLREGNLCYYADEDAIAPLWKGQRFPLETCISGWAMLNRKPAVIEDIYADPRIAADVYRPTFVKSLAMVPIRTEAPIGAIGNYWATRRQPTNEEVELLQVLADTTAVAMENLRVHGELEQRVRDRTAQLENVNRELDAFSLAVSHDLRAPLRHIRGYTQMFQSEYGNRVDEKGRRLLAKIDGSATNMRGLIDDLLRLSRITRTDLRQEPVNLSAMAREITERLAAETPLRKVEVQIADDLKAEGDAGLLRAALENLLSNAWKYTAKREAARIEFGVTSQADGSPVYFVRDNGVGFDMRYADKLFQPFQRLHPNEEFTGSGMGLSTVQRIINRHGGRVWAASAVEQGATFYFTLNPAHK